MYLYDESSDVHESKRLSSFGILQYSTVVNTYNKNENTPVAIIRSRREEEGRNSDFILIWVGFSDTIVAESSPCLRKL